MFAAIEWVIAIRYLRSRRQEGFISIIAWFSLTGIALGVATLIIVMSVMNGFRSELLSRILGLNGHVLVQGVGTPLRDYDEIARRIRRIDGVVRATPIAEGQVMATANQVATGALVRGMRPDDLRARRIVASKIVRGSLDNFRGQNQAVIGDRLARKLGLDIGDRITLISPKGSNTAFGFVPRLISYTVVATFDVGMYEYDSGYIFVPLKRLQKYLRLGDGVSAVEVEVRDADSVGVIKERIASLLAGRPVRLFDWQQANAGFFSAIEVERNVMFLILTLIIVVAAFNIISSMIMLVKDKGRDIAILRTMGAGRGMILRIFIIAGASVGVIGTAVGAVLGLVFVINIDEIRQWLEGLTGMELWNAEIRFLSRIPAILDTGEATLVIIMALALSFLATLYPAWRAARLDPVEALRYE